MHFLDLLSGQPASHSRKRHYQFKDTLGVGGFAEVKRATCTDTGEDVAIKIIPKAKIRDHEQQVFRQNTLLSLKHEHIIELKEWFESKERYYLVFELAAGGELFEHLIESPNYRFSEAEAREVIYALVDGVKYLHSKNIIHRDLKPENILYRTPPGSHPEVGHDDCVISDFGLAAYIPPGERLYTIAGSAGYSAPEMYPTGGVSLGRARGAGYGLKADVWSLGVIAFCCMGGRFPYKKTDPFELAEEARTTKLYFPKTWDVISSDAKHFIRWLLTVDEDKRPSIEEALEHPWLRSALSRPPSPHIQPNLPVFTPQSSRSNSPVHDTPEHALLTRKATLEVPKMDALGSRLSRTETVTRHAPVLEHRETMEALGMNKVPSTPGTTRDASTSSSP
ncbi:serine/threonine-protein kinase [Sporobolomyces koalae]|uniref:serine/threonine-protein kinase n=1 Tax=Sporobolomyces koalae TaxID=500713 RepID=UPI00316C706B